MKLNLLEIGKVINKALKNKDQYIARIEHFRENPIVGTCGSVEAILDLDKSRISNMKIPGLSDEQLDQVVKAVNNAFDQADKVWLEFEK